jgi:hypothetical protein
MTITTPTIFGQVFAAPTHQLLHQNSASNQAQVTVFVCNQGPVVDNFTIALIPSSQGSTTPVTKNYIAFDTPLIAGGVFAVSGIGLNVQDSIQVSSSQGTCSFTATGIEFAPG